jgi:hypothetical protein
MCIVFGTENGFVIMQGGDLCQTVELRWKLVNGSQLLICGGKHYRELFLFATSSVGVYWYLSYNLTLDNS